MRYLRYVWGLIATFIATEAEASEDKWFGNDKYLHGGVSVVVAASAYGGAALLTGDRNWRAVSGMGAVVLVGGAKEFWDMSNRGDPSFRDFAWDVGGGLVGVGVSLLVDMAITRATR